MESLADYFEQRQFREPPSKLSPLEAFVMVIKCYWPKDGPHKFSPNLHHVFDARGIPITRVPGNAATEFVFEAAILFIPNIKEAGLLDACSRAMSRIRKLALDNQREIAP
jgi:hypothetical protein